MGEREKEKWQQNIQGRKKEEEKKTSNGARDLLWGCERGEGKEEELLEEIMGGKIIKMWKRERGREGARNVVFRKVGHVKDERVKERKKKSNKENVRKIFCGEKEDVK